MDKKTGKVTDRSPTIDNLVSSQLFDHMILLVQYTYATKKLVATSVFVH